MKKTLRTGCAFTKHTRCFIRLTVQSTVSMKISLRKSRKACYNVSAFSDATDDETKGFLQFVKTGEAETSFAREIMEAVDYAKMMDPDFYHHYMMVRLHENDLRYEGRQQGAHEKAIETARALFALGVVTVEQIAQVTGLSLEDVQRLQIGMNVDL